MADRATPAVAIVGSVHMDLVATAARLPRRGETMPGSRFAMHSGGKGGNQAVQVALAGVDARFVGRVGQDAFGDELRRALRAKGVDLSYLGVDPDEPTGVSTVLAEEGGDYASIIVPGASLRLTPALIEAARPAIAAARVLLCQLEIAPETVLAAVEMARESATLVVLNAAPAPTGAEDFPPAFWAAVDVLVVNAGEAAALDGRDGVEPATAGAVARRLRARLGIGAVVVTLGAAGCVAVDGRGERRFPGHAVTVVDTIGAGDAFTGTLAAELARGALLDHALPQATAAGALAVTRAGAYDALPSGEAVRELAGREPSASP